MIPARFYKIGSNISYIAAGISWLSILAIPSSVGQVFSALGTSLAVIAAGYAATHWLFRDKPFAQYALWLSEHSTQIDVFAYAALWLGAAVFIGPWYSSAALSTLYLFDEIGMLLSSKWLDAERFFHKTFDDEDIFR